MEQLILKLPNLKRIFQVDFDASVTMLGGVLNQKSQPIACFSKKLDEAMNTTNKKNSLYSQIIMHCNLSTARINETKSI